MLFQRGPLGLVIQYLPFSLTTSTPLMVALSRPFPDGTNERSAKRQGRSFVTSTSDCPNPRQLPALLPDLALDPSAARRPETQGERSGLSFSDPNKLATQNEMWLTPRAWEMVASTYAA